MRKWSVGFVVVVAVAIFLPVTADAAWTWTPQTGRWLNTKRLPKETAELQIEYTRGLLLQGEIKQALDETEKFTRFYADSDLADQNQFLRGEIKLALGKEMDAAKEFQQLVTKYPNTTLYDAAIKKQYEIGDKLYEQGQQLKKKKFRLFRGNPLKKAIQVYSMVITNQPFTDAAAEAQYKVGLCHYARKEYVEAAFEYKRVIEDYSTSEWVDDARYGLAKCYYEGSLPPAYDQEPSQLAINAADEFVAQYPDDARAEEVKTIRTEMREKIAQQRLQTAQYYARRRNFEAARIYYTMLSEKFGETTAGAKAKEWLEKNPDTQVTAAERVVSPRVF